MNKTIRKDTSKSVDNSFILVEASKLSMDDEFMQYKPFGARQTKLKLLLSEIIQKGIDDFYCPNCNPSINEDNTGIVFKVGENPVTGKSYEWWEKVAKEFMPERHSRLGTISEYVAFLGVFIKRLVEEKKWSIANAWYTVCDDSRDLRTYYNGIYCSKAIRVRKILGFYDLTNFIKILSEDESVGGYWQVGFNTPSGITSIGMLNHVFRCKDYSSSGVGWIILLK